MKKRRSVLLITEWQDLRFQHGVAKYAREVGWHLTLDTVYVGDFPWGWSGDGCITAMVRKENVEFIRSLKVPVVDTSPQQHKVIDVQRIHEDDRAFGNMAAKHFLEVGFRNFAWYSCDELPVSKRRFSGFTECVEKAGYSCENLTLDKKEKDKAKTWQMRKMRLTKRLANLSKPVAIFCVDDRMAVDIVEAALDAELPVPDHVAVMGVGNLEIACECSVVPISSIEIDYEAFGYETAELLEKIMNGGVPPISPILLPPVRIVQRKSTDTLAANDHRAQIAIRYILDHNHENIGVDDIARASAMSRRQLNYVIKKELGVGPAAVLQRVRLKKAKELLEDTDFTVDTIAGMSGFGSALRLHRVFRRELRTSPGAYRCLAEKPPSRAIGLRVQNLLDARS